MTVSPALRFTYDDYLLLPEDRRYEIIDGDLFMTPAPTPYHQLVSINLGSSLRDFVLEHRLGRVLYAPCDVVLSPTDVVQPDILFVASDRLSIIGEKYISEAPDLVVEILSPATADRDQDLKKKLYARFGVREFWLADPEKKTVEVFVNTTEGFRRESLFGAGETLRSPLLPGLEIPLAEVF
jgi:Uma2 family endonuclease